MGFLSKIWKGIKKTVKKIFKPIKRVFKSIGKFMGKIGIVGQIAMSFILPGLGSALSGTFSNIVGGLMKGALGPAGKAAGWVLGKAGEFAKMAYKGYKTVSGAVTDFIGTTGKYVGGKLGIPGMEKMTLEQAFGSEGWGGRLTDSFSELGDAAGEFFDTDVKGVLPKPTNVPGTGVLKQEELAKQPSLDPASEYQQAMQKELDYISDPISNQRSAFTPLETLDPDVYDASKAVAMQGKGPLRLDSVVETTKAAQDVKDLEVFGKPFKVKSLLSQVGEKAVDKFASIPASLAQQYGGQKLGIYDEPMGDPGPAWGPQYYQQTVSQPTMPFQQATAEMPMPSFYQNYVASSPLMGVDQGSWLGEDFWKRELQARVA